MVPYERALINAVTGQFVVKFSFFGAVLCGFFGLAIKRPFFVVLKQLVVLAACRSRRLPKPLGGNFWVPA